ncbi:hypothetical protein EVA_07077 [gut metagenome]|uniref:Uncharacterized protein n=1 Tax=gut metagenome TaxID=749906 RepID=J9GW38_9ZZZZ
MHFELDALRHPSSRRMLRGATIGRGECYSAPTYFIGL